MAKKQGGGGCGCCGPGCLLVVLFLAALVWLSYEGYTKLNRWAADEDMALPSPFAAEMNYGDLRRNLDHFLADPNEKTLTLTDGQINLWLQETPELGPLKGRLVAVIHEGKFELHGSIPLQTLLFSRRYLNFILFMQPVIRDGNVTLNVLRVVRNGEPVAPKELSNFQNHVAPWLQQGLSLSNQIRGDKQIKEMHVENSNLILSR